MMFRNAALRKFAEMVDDKNFVCHGRLNEEEMGELILICSKPLNRGFLDVYGLELSDVEYVVEMLKGFHEEWRYEPTNPNIFWLIT